MNAPHQPVALQAWTNDQLVAAGKLADSKIDAVKEQIRDLQAHFEKLMAEKDRALEKVLCERDKANAQNFASSKEAVVAAMTASQKAIDKAEENSAKWQANANEWRAAMNDKDKLLLQRAEFGVYKDGMADTLSDLKARVDLMQGKSQGLNAGWAILIGVIGLIGVIVGVISAVARFAK